MIRRITANAQMSLVEERTLDGKDYYVVPIVMGVEGILPGSDGPGLYPAEEWENGVPSWNHKPVVVYHPVDKDGNYTTAADPAVIEQHQVGFLLNTQWDGKLRTWGWIDQGKVGKVSPEVEAAIKQKKPMEVSTGLFCSKDYTAGVFNDQTYDFVARNHRPDHLALLPTGVGACSMKMGAGMLVVNASKDPKPRSLDLALAEAVAAIGGTLVGNSVSFSETTEMLSKALSAKYGRPGEYWEGWVREVFPDQVVFRGEDNQTYAQPWKWNGNVVELVGDAVPVIRQTAYVTKDGKKILTANSAGNQGDDEMPAKFDRKAHIAKLVANGYSKEKEKLEKLDDETLALIRAPEEAPKPAPVVNEDDDREEEEAPKPKKKAKEKEAPAPGFLANATPEERRAFLDMKRTADKVRKGHIEKILANDRNEFEEEFLANLQTDDLEKLAKLAAAPAAKEEEGAEESVTANSGGSYLGWLGAHDVGITANAGKKGEEKAAPKNRFLSIPEMFPAKK